MAPLPRSRTRPGAWTGRYRSRGFILVDVLTALVIAAISFAAGLGGAASSIRLVAAQGEKVAGLVEKENSRVQHAPDLVSGGP